jgi:CheY-like chemotaxis protein
MPLDILIVDDSAAIRKILQRVLRQADVDVGQVYEAGDGLEALETLKKHKVHLVLADVNMPNMNGMQLLAEIKSDAELASRARHHGDDRRQPEQSDGSGATGSGGLHPQALLGRSNQGQDFQSLLNEEGRGPRKTGPGGNGVRAGKFCERGWERCLQI